MKCLYAAIYSVIGLKFGLHIIAWVLNPIYFE